MSHKGFSEVGIKEQLYILFLEIKGELTKKNIEIDSDQIEEIVKNTQIETIINYMKEMVHILINFKFPHKSDKSQVKENKSKDEQIRQLESQIRKLEYDIKYLLQKEFQNKIKRDALEMKVNAYIDMENEFEELKEKVKYEGGKFLNNERKDNEIIILRRENCILKKEIDKHEMNNKNYETKLKSEKETIVDLKHQISSLNQKVFKLELLNSRRENFNHPIANNSSINININNNDNSSSKWVIKQENQDLTNLNNNNNINNNSNSFSNLGFKKRKVNNFPKNNTKYSSNGLGNTNRELNIRTNSIKYEQGKIGSGLQTKKYKINGMNTIDNNDIYNKILSNLYSKDNKSSNKRENRNKNKNKKNNSSVSVYMEEYDRSIFENKCISNKGKKYNSNRKSKEYNKKIGFTPKSRFPLSGKHRESKNNNAHSLPKKYLQNDKNYSSYSSLLINRK